MHIQNYALGVSASVKTPLWFLVTVFSRLASNKSVGTVVVSRYPRRNLSFFVLIIEAEHEGRGYPYS